MLVLAAFLRRYACKTQRDFFFNVAFEWVKLPGVKLFTTEIYPYGLVARPVTRRTINNRLKLIFILFNLTVH